MAKVVSKMSRGDRIYADVQEAMRGLREGRTEKIMDGLKRYPKDFVEWRDIHTNYTALMALSRDGDAKLVDMLLKEADKISPDAKKELINQKDSRNQAAWDWTTTPEVRVVLREHGAIFDTAKLVRPHHDDVTRAFYIANMATEVREELRKFPEIPRR